MKRATKHEKKMRWLGDNEAYLEATYPGLWVAIDDDGLAGVGSTFGAANDDAARNNRTDVMMVSIRGADYQGVYLIASCH